MEGKGKGGKESERRGGEREKISMPLSNS